MGASGSAWGVEIGSAALKAVRLERSGDEVQLADFVYIPHKKVLSTPDLDADEATRLALGQFVSQQRDLGSEPVVVSVPGNAAFARFAKLPPVEQKKIPDIVKFEAVQQIPFPIDEVEWDYSTFMQEGLPDVEVGIFAITKQSVQGRLALYSELGLFPDGLTISPVAVFNAISHDLDLDDSSPGVIVLDIGTASTDLIVAEEGRAWIRTIPIGGHNFTEALISAFKLTYSKAEKLKSEAQTSKYRRQILSAMRPVFADLAQEVQRSIGYYQSLHRDANLTKLVGVGSTFKLPGLRKFLSQQLQMEVIRLDEYNKIKPAGRGEAQFSEHAVNYATAYGLALQGVGLSKIDVNLVPVGVVRDRLWSQKIKWFGAAAALVVLGSLATFSRPLIDGKFKDQPIEHATYVTGVIREARELKSRFDEVTQETEVDARPQNVRDTLRYRDVWPNLMGDVTSILASANPQPELYSTSLEEATSIPPGQRRVIELVSLRHEYVQPTTLEEQPKLKISMQVRTPNSGGVSFINGHAIAWMRANLREQRPGVPYIMVKEPEALNVRPITIQDENTGFGSRSGGRPSLGGERGGGSRGYTGETSGSYEGSGEFGGVNPNFGERGGRSIGGAGSLSLRSLDAMAPLPEPADNLPSGTTVYEVTIQWTIELLPADAPAPQEEEG